MTIKLINKKDIKDIEISENTTIADILKKEEIPLEARIIAIADVYDALRQKRCYKESYSHEKAVEIIKNERGKHFDPMIVDIFLKNNGKFKEIFDCA